MSVPGSKAWLRIQKGKGTYCPQMPSSGLTHPSSRMWLRLTALSLTGHCFQPQGTASPKDTPFQMAAIPMTGWRGVAEAWIPCLHSGCPWRAVQAPELPSGPAEASDLNGISHMAGQPLPCPVLPCLLPTSISQEGSLINLVYAVLCFRVCLQWTWPKFVCLGNEKRPGGIKWRLWGQGKM